MEKTGDVLQCANREREYNETIVLFLQPHKKETGLDFEIENKKRTTHRAVSSTENPQQYPKMNRAASQSLKYSISRTQNNNRVPLLHCKNCV